MLRHLHFVLLALTGFACNETFPDEPAVPCTVGALSDCTCADGRAGRQRCLEGGALSACDCPRTDGGAEDGDLTEPDAGAADSGDLWDAWTPEGDAADPDAFIPDLEPDIWLPDAEVADPDAWVPDLDAWVPDLDAFVEPDPDVFVPDPDAFVPDPDASVPDPDAFVDPEPAVNVGWIGGACDGDWDCEITGGRCAREDEGYPRGTCTQACDRFCPDRGDPTDTVSFCVTNQRGFGTCLARCDYNLLPGTGCRPGYGCAISPRHAQRAVTNGVCVPLSPDGTARVINTLQSALEEAAEAAGLQGERLALVDLTHPDDVEWAQINGMSSVYPASVIKVAVMAEAEHQIENGVIRLNQTQVISEESETCTGSDDRPTLRTGNTPTVELLIDLMITRSDNTATNALIDLLGRENITGYMADLGLTGIGVYRKVFGCEPYDDAGWDREHRNVMTALDTATLLVWIFEGASGFVGEAGRQRMLGFLAGQRHRDGLFQGLPADAEYWSKTGVTSTVTHDAGLILWRGQRYAIAAFTELAPGPGWQKLEALGRAMGELMAGR